MPGAMPITVQTPDEAVRGWTTEVHVKGRGGPLVRQWAPSQTSAPGKGPWRFKTELEDNSATNVRPSSMDQLIPCIYVL